MITKAWLGVALSVSAQYPTVTHGRSRQVKLKPCLHCQQTHQHNNSYCSAECCRAHRGDQTHER